MQPFSVGTCLGDAFDGLRRAWLTVLVALAFALPLVSAALRVLARPRLLEDYAFTLVMIPGIELWVGTVITVAVVSAHFDRELTVGRILLISLRRVVPVYLVLVLIALVVFAIGFACSLPYASRETWSGGIPPGALAMFALWLLGSAFLYSRWFVAVPAAAVETWNPLAALRRSDRLTRGHRGALFAILALIGTIAIGTLAIVEVRLGDRPDIDALLFAVAMIGAIPLIIVRAAISATAYAQLRAAQESDDPAWLAKVFG